jgi:hypothetical protein
MSAPPQRGMSGLYANLLADSSSSTSNSSATISKAPVVFSQQGSASSPPGNQSVEDGTSSTQKKINAGIINFPFFFLLGVENIFYLFFQRGFYP